MQKYCIFFSHKALWHSESAEKAFVAGSPAGGALDAHDQTDP